MFEDEHLLEGGRCGSASHCETLTIAVARLSHQLTLSQPPIAFTCSISPFAAFPLRTSPPAPAKLCRWVPACYPAQAKPCRLVPFSGAPREPVGYPATAPGGWFYRTTNSYHSWHRRTRIR